MITPQQLRDKARRLYPKAIAAWLAGQEFFPRRIPADLSLPTDISAAVDAVQSLREHAQSERAGGYRIEWQSRRSRAFGQNEFPHEIHIDSMDDLCTMIGELPSWRSLQKDVAKIRRHLPGLEAWMQEPGRWRNLLEVSRDLDGLTALTEYFVANPRPDVFGRQIPIAASSKLLEKHRRLLADWLDRLLPPAAIDPRYDCGQFEPRYGLRYARPHFLIRALDPNLATRIGWPFSECSLPAETISKLPVTDANVFIVENKVNLLTMPSVHRGIVLGGLGNGVVQLTEIAWLHDRQVIYWGDLDAAGFEILSRLRGLLPDVRSLLMNPETLNACRDLASDHSSQVPKTELQLTPTEYAAYETICHEGVRIEQEHIPDQLVTTAIENVFADTF